MSCTLSPLPRLTLFPMGISVRYLLLILLLLDWNLFSATYYVATNGNNSADGSVSTPWSNIWYAAKNPSVVSGDTVIVKAGEYNEFVTNTLSGTYGNPITFTGERGTSGEWLTIIDPSTPFTNGWTTASEIGTGVWKQVSMPFSTRELTIGHKRVAFVYTNGDMSVSIGQGYVSSGMSNGVQFLTLPSDAVVSNVAAKPFQFWDSVKALYGTTNDGTNFTTYLRLRDGSDPNGLNIRSSPNKDDYVTSDKHYFAVKLIGISNVVYRNFLIRGAFSGFGIYNSGADNNLIESNYVANGYTRIFVATHASNNIVRNNHINCDYYGYDDPGAWTQSGTNYNMLLRANLYSVAKFLMGQSGSFDYDVYLGMSGNSNSVSGNVIFKGLGTGIEVEGDGTTTPIFGTKVYGNMISNMTSVGILLSEGETYTSVYSNTVLDCNTMIRPHHMDVVGETNRIVYIYRNVFWLPAQVGEHVYFHFNNSSPDTYFPEYWFYHNSFSGGRYCIDVSSDSVGSGGIQGARFLNNIISESQYIADGNIGSGFLTNSTMMGAFDYNLVTSSDISYPSYDPAAWFGVHNIRPSSPVWETNFVPSFRLPVGSPAVNSAIDLTQPFIINGTNYSALPYGSDIKIGPAWDMGAFESGTAIQTTTLRVGTMRMSQ